MYTFKV